jgi:hypothetical protein
MAMFSVNIPAQSASLTGFPVYLAMADFPVSFWTDLAHPWAGDLRAKDSGGNLIPIDVLWIDRVNHVGTVFVKTSLSSTSNTVFYMEYGDSTLQRLPYTDPNGRNAVWSDYHRVFFFGDYLGDRTGSGSVITFPFQFVPSFSGTTLNVTAFNAHQGVAFDGTFFYVIQTNILFKYDTSFNLIATNNDPTGDAGPNHDHCGDGFVLNGSLYIPMAGTTHAYNTLAQFNCSDLTYAGQRPLTAPVGPYPGGTTWTAGCCYVPEWDQIVFVDFLNTGSPALYVHDNDASLTFDREIPLTTPIFSAQGIEWWRGAFWVNEDLNDQTFRIESDGTEKTAMYAQSSAASYEGITQYGSNLYVLHSTDTAHGFIDRLALRTNHSVAPGWFANDTIDTLTFGTIPADRFTDWTLGASIFWTASTAIGQNYISYTNLTTDLNTTRAAIASRTLVPRMMGGWDVNNNWIHGLPPLVNDSTFFEDFRTQTVGSQPSGWTERWNTGAGSVTVRNGGLFSPSNLEYFQTGSNAKYACSFLNSITDCEVLYCVYFAANNDNMGRMYVRGSGNTGAEYCYFAFIQPSNGTVGVQKYVNGASSGVGNTAKAIDPSIYYFSRFRVIGSSIKLKVWPITDAEPAAWDLELTDTAVSTAGWVGVGAATSGVTAAYYEFIKVNTDGSTVVAPSPVVTDAGAITRINLIQTNTTSRAMFRNGVGCTKLPALQMPAVGADTLYIGAEGHLHASGMNGYIEFMYLREGALSNDWVAVEYSNITDPDFYEVGPIVSPATYRTLAYATDLASGRDGWFLDTYTPHVITHYGEEGSGIHSTLVGSVTGGIYQLTGTSDNGTAIPCAVRTPALDQGDPRYHKLYGDILLDCDTNNTNLTVVPATNNFVVPGLSTTVNNAVRTKAVVQLNSTGWISARNVGLDITWDVNGTKPFLYAWEPRFTEESAKVLAYSWETCWVTHELPGYFYHGYLYVVHVSTADLTFRILNPDSTAAATVTIPNSGGTLYSKSFIRLPVVKGNIFKYKISSTAQFRLSGDESELLVKPWGQGGEWKHEKIFQDLPQSAPAEQVEGE